MLPLTLATASAAAAAGRYGVRPFVLSAPFGLLAGSGVDVGGGRAQIVLAALATTAAVSLVSAVRLARRPPDESLLKRRVTLYWRFWCGGISYWLTHKDPCCEFLK